MDDHKTICFKCFEEDDLKNFFPEEAGLISHHFRTMHHKAAVDSAKCKAGFEDRYGNKNYRFSESFFSWSPAERYVDQTIYELFESCLALSSLFPFPGIPRALFSLAPAPELSAYGQSSTKERVSHTLSCSLRTGSRLGLGWDSRVS